jgi:hypothetical protein
MILLNGTPQEITEFLKLHPEGFGSTEKSSGQSSVEDALVEPGNNWTRRSMHDFYARIYGKNKEVVGFVIRNGGSTTRSEIMKHFGFSRDSAGGGHRGILAAIAKHARSATKSKDASLFHTSRPEPGVIRYSIHPEILHLIREMQLDFGGEA